MSFAKILYEFAGEMLNRAVFEDAEKLFHPSLQIYNRLDGSRADVDHVAFALRG